MSSPFADLASFTALPRVVDLALAPSAESVVLAVQSPDSGGARYVSSLWRVDSDGSTEPVRLTRSAKGESAPSYTPDGGLIFVSARPDPESAGADEDEPALWLLPPHGEAAVLAAAPGGLTAPVVASISGTIVALGSRLLGTADLAADAERRRVRRERKVNAVLHTGMPIRSWDHEVEDVSPRLYRVDADGGVHDLTQDATHELTDTAFTISADGRTVAALWLVREAHGQYRHVVVVIDTESGVRQRIAGGEGITCSSPTIAPDGAHVAVIQEAVGRFDSPMHVYLRIVSTEPGWHLDSPMQHDLGDLTPTGLAWAPDGETVYVTGDLHGSGAIVAVDVSTGAVRSRLAADAVYGALRPAADGNHLFALRTGIDSPPTPVRLDVAFTDQEPVRLPTPAPRPDLPGEAVDTSTAVDGAQVRGWLCLPADAAPDRPAPLMVWVHGGPFTSWNAWSWRWNPWVAVAHGWAVLLPDPALSTGYGPDWIGRAWPHRAAEVWRDVEGLLDHVARRPEVDADRSALLGGSFGGYMTNWIAGHTDRFGAIVTHAGLWALDQQHTTTDHAEWKTGLFGRPDEHPDWYAQNSPHHFVDAITTPMLVVHGNRDYRVPVSEALRLWWDLVEHHDGDPATLAHRFLQFTNENHWILSPANAQIWYETVLAFCAQHVLGADPARSDLL